eukprot:m.11940 g.11940  ORF g.11940 m.11940 type:complete len:361 (-) comp9071_c0_seq1:26-1108(-)
MLTCSWVVVVTTVAGLISHSNAAVGDITHVVYRQGTTAYASNPGEIQVVPNRKYLVNFEILRNDLGQDHEYVTNIIVGGQNYGPCRPDGHDYDCNFYNCTRAKQMIVTPTTTVLKVDMRIIGHSWDCDCDTKTWQCSKENTIAGRTQMTAVGRFTLTAIGSIAPTTAPTQAPTMWFANPGHRDTIDNLTQTVLMLETSLGAITKTQNQRDETFNKKIDELTTNLTTTNNNLGIVTKELNTTVFEMGRITHELEAKLETLSNQLNATRDELAITKSNLTSTSQLLGNLRQTLKDLGSVQFATEPPPQGSTFAAPSIEASSGDIVVTSFGGAMLLRTQKCVSVDLCETTRFTAMIKEALANL